MDTKKLGKVIVSLLVIIGSLKLLVSSTMPSIHWLILLVLWALIASGRLPKNKKTSHPHL